MIPAGTGRRHRPAGLANAAGSMSFMGAAPHRNGVLEVGFCQIPGLPQINAFTAEFITHRYGHTAVLFHPNGIAVQPNGAVNQQVFYMNNLLNVPPLNIFRIEYVDNQGNWVPVPLHPMFPAIYILVHHRAHRIVISGVIWEIWLPQMQQSRQAIGPGAHNLLL
ncbi:hypothetical protein BD626DRAFT_478713 [Schizophyllum amplum]|uniref:Uncharacterized protein n=1 Tax=Schizophyllum amplum TaxID=97359 RepID=A0A550CRI0_9AGAR|nr:hypothetical protein BD626DRAFT_478713 [Auriculariopsis ampla]